MKKKIKLALLGCGSWGKNLARCFDDLNVLSFIFDPSESVRSNVKNLYPKTTISNSLEEVLSNPEINAVVIANQAELHFLTVKQALMAGKDVFVEKPLSLTLEEGKELVLLAKEKGKVLFIGHLLQYHPAVIKIKKMIKEDKLGKLQYIYSNRLNLGKFRKAENVLWSFAPHDISVILSLAQEMPTKINVSSSNAIQPMVSDTTTTHLKFSSGLSAHIFVSWLHPFKEQKLVVIGEKMMVVFDDTLPLETKLICYPHKIGWENNIPSPQKKDGLYIDLADSWEEPLKIEAKSFLEAIQGKPYITDGEEGLRVLTILEKAQENLNIKSEGFLDYYIHETSIVDEDCTIGKGTKIWHYSHILKNSKIGKDVNIGQNVMIGPKSIVGNNVKIQNNVSVYQGVTLEDDVFCGPSCVFTNVINPRSRISRKHEFKTTLVKCGATIGANATILCGITIGRYSFVGAGAVVTKDIPDHAIVFGNPAQIMGRMCECGEKLDDNGKCTVCLKTTPSEKNNDEKKP